MTYQSALTFLDSLVNYEKLTKPRDDFKLDDIRQLLARAGNPQEQLKNVILVAGTKGKGSVCYMLDAALRGCGLTTGLFVSPHVLSVRERIQLDGKLLSPQVFARQVERLEPLARKQPVSYFEMTAAMAFDLFARRELDYQVVEVGLGGRLDATNLSAPQISVITRIGYDHVKVLGDTLRKIAREKAGIMRSGKPVVVSAQAPEAGAELVCRARVAEARLVPSGSRVRIRGVRTLPTGVSFEVASQLGQGRINLPLLGRHQVENCRTALAVLDLLARSDKRINLAAITKGLAGVSIPARCQIVSRRPFIMVDSCHNPESGRALANVIRDHLGKKVVLVYGSLAGKLVEQTVRPLVPLAERAILVQPDSPRAMPLPELRRIFTGLGVPCVTAASIPAALSLARDSSLGTGHSSLPVIVAGSFYLAGEALKLLTGRGRK